MFDRIFNSGAPDALKKYKATYEGKQVTDLATINEGRQLMDLLQAEAPKFRKGSIGLPPASLLAIGGGGLQKGYIPISEMVDDGFSADVPIHLQLEIEQGAARDTSDDVGGEHAATKGAVLLEVFDTIYSIVSAERTGGKGARDLALRGIFQTIDDAAAAGASFAVKAKPAPAEKAAKTEKAEK